MVIAWLLSASAVADAVGSAPLRECGVCGLSAAGSGEPCQQRRGEPEDWSSISLATRRRRSGRRFLPLTDALLRDERRRSTAQPEDVLLDVHVNGVRCLVVREHPRARVLSPREREIARMVSLGYPTKSIAADLGISAWTVSTHLRRIFAKLGVRTRAAMVARLADGGLLIETESESGEAER